MTDLKQEIESLRALPREALLERYEAEYGRPPRQKNRGWLWRRLAWKLHERRLGGLSETARRRLEELIAEIEIPPADVKRTVSGLLVKKRPGGLAVGTVLTRTWHGRDLQCVVRADGFELDGVVHKTLSAAARAATGQKWNPALFWGLRDRKRAK